MKKSLFIISLIFSLVSVAQTRNFAVTVSNKWVNAKADEPVVVKLKDLKGLDFAVKKAVVKLDGAEIPCQLDDMDGDLRSDELVFLANIQSKAVQKYDVTLSAEGVQTEYPQRLYHSLSLVNKKETHPEVTNLEADGDTYLFNDVYMHGVTIESELVGYRIYFDPRQNIDLYGKKYRRLEIAKTQFYTSAEQLAEGYGVDVLWAGGAIGCGTLRGWNGKAPALLDDVKRRGQKIISCGPVRCVVELMDLGWNVAGKGVDASSRVNARTYYTLYAGHRDVEVNVKFDSPLGDEKFCTGVQKVGTTATDSVRRGIKSEGWTREDGVAASWGCDYPDMGKKALWAPEPIGMAVYVPGKYIDSQLEDELNYLFVLAAKGQTDIKYYLTFCADKEQDGYHTANDWFDSLDSWKESLENHVKILVSGK